METYKNEFFGSLLKEDQVQLLSADLMDLESEPLIKDPRPSWESWFMTLAFVIAQRSLDKDTKHGCVIVSDSEVILSVGYNGPPRGCRDDIIPLKRPLKYKYMEHAEENAIVNAACTGACIGGSTFYVTGPPCYGCFRKILNVKAKRLIHGNILHQRSQEDLDAIKLMNQDQRLEVIEYPHVIPVLKLLNITQTYIKQKEIEDKS